MVNVYHEVSLGIEHGYAPIYSVIGLRVCLLVWRVLLMLSACLCYVWQHTTRHARAIHVTVCKRWNEVE